MESAGDVVVENGGEGIDTVVSSIDYALGSNVENLRLTGTAASNAIGNAADNVIYGNNADNVLDGGAGIDGLVGGGGNDTYFVDNFSDAVFESTNGGTDTVLSSVSYYKGLEANVENLTLVGNENLGGMGNALDNLLTGNGGNNMLIGGQGADTMIGGMGNDIYVVENAGDLVVENAGQGNDTVQSSISYTLGNNVENLVLDGTAAINGTGNAGDNYLGGNSAANVLDGGAGRDSMFGRAGNDTYIVDNFSDLVSENYNEGTDTILSSIDYVLGSNVENLTLTGSSAIYAYGNELNNTLVGNGAANVLRGGAGNDTYVVGAGDSVMENVGEGIDTVQSEVSFTLGADIENLILIGAANINAIGNTLNNTLQGNSGNNLLDGGVGGDTMLGAQGDDTYIVENVGDMVTENLNEGTDTVQSSITYMLGANVENLTLTGTGAINGTGNALDNIFTGNSAANTLTGGAGNDTYIVGAGDVVVEAAGGGIDTVQSALTYTLGSNVENLTLTGTATINGTGNSLNNVLIGNSAANTLTGGAGNDTYVVGTGDTVVESNNGGTDTVQSAIAWTLGSNLENLTLLGTAAISGTGNSLDNVMIGNGGANVLSGANGNDTLRGNAGNDTVNGGAGNDTYLFGRGEGPDLLQDSGGTADKILYDSGVNPLDLVISRQANDLRLSIHGSTDQVTIQNWYSSLSNRTETIQAGNGQTLLSTQVDQLIQAMASFSQQSGLTWDQAIDQQPTQVQSILAASWQ